MSDKKKSSKNTKSKKTGTVKETLFRVYALLFLLTGLMLLFFTEDFTLITIKGEYERITNIVQKFLANTYLIIGILIFFIRKIEGRIMTNIIVSLIIIGFVNLYLLFLLNDETIVPLVFFVAQIVMQISLVIALYDQVKKK